MPRKRAVEPSASDVQHPRVVLFYSDKAGKEFREFSNFYSPSPFVFELPEAARHEGWNQRVHCEFSEKAIMLSKAALMRDPETFTKIEQATDPKVCKSLGRSVRNFDQALWDEHLKEVAFEVVRQKFESSARLRRLLLSTGDAILAEAAPNDCVWGIGLGTQDKLSLNRRAGADATSSALP